MQKHYVGFNSDSRRRASRTGDTTMSANIDRSSAIIYEFPKRGHFAVNAQREESNVASMQRAPKIAFGSSWYHDEAIQEERRGN
jgi:hypothetical protein